MKLLVTRVLTAVAVLATVLTAPSTAAHAAGQLYRPYCDFKPNEFATGEARHTPVKGVDAWLIGITVPPRTSYQFDGMWMGRSEYCQIGKSLFVQQSDGNLVLYDENNTARWASSWFRERVLYNATGVSFQSDGNLVQHDNSGQAVWASNTYGPPGGCYNACLTRKLAIQYDGNVVIYDGDTVLWQTRTYH